MYGRLLLVVAIVIVVGVSLRIKESFATPIHTTANSSVAMVIN